MTVIPMPVRNVPPTDDPLLTVADCARRLGLSMQKVRDEIKAGELPARVCKRLSGRTLYRIERADFEVYLARVWPKEPKQQT